MRGLHGAAVAIAIVLAAGMMVGSGFAGLHDGGPADEFGDERDDLNKTADDASPDSGVASGGLSVLQLGLSFMKTFVEVLVFAATLPVSLQRLGLPLWFSAPAGLIAQIGAFATIGQFLRGAVLR